MKIIEIFKIKIFIKKKFQYVNHRGKILTLKVIAIL